MKHTERFTDTVKDYVKYRPTYPEAVFELLTNLCQLKPEQVIADVGSGTGIFTKLLLEHGYQKVYAVEPNAAMRAAAENELRKFPGFVSINGTGEQTNLPDNSVDLITVATAFHWIDPVKAKVEFKRILKPQGLVVLIWNLRDRSLHPLMHAYDQLLMKYGIDYQKASAEHYDSQKVAEFFMPNLMQEYRFDFKQSYNFMKLKGRMDSTSYAPRPSHPNYEHLITELKAIFDRYQNNGQVEFIYETAVYIGKLD